MRYPRLAGSLVLAAGFVWLTVPATPSAAQTPADAYRKEAKRPSDVISLMPQFKDGSKEVNPKGPDGAKNVDALKRMAEYLVFPVTHSEFYTTTIERKTAEGKKIDLGQLDRDKTLDGVLFELDRYVLVPETRSKSPTNQYEFIQEFGKVLDAAATSILNDPSNTPPPVKLNAVRALAVACKSGAKAHAKTVTDLLTNKKWPLYIKYHALKAAENLLAAGDVMELQGPNPWKHSIPDADVAAIVNAIEAIIGEMNKSLGEPAAEPAKAAAAPAGAKPATPPAKPAEPDSTKTPRTGRSRSSCASRR
jgi:hypothetical protein